MSAKPEPFEFDIAREFPDGLIVDGVFYPFMVDCPNCECDTSDYCAHCSEGVVIGTHGTEPCKCDGDGKVRNPALEWMYYCNHSASLWKDDQECIKPKNVDHSKCRFIAVGVK